MVALLVLGLVETDVGVAGEPCGVDQFGVDGVLEEVSVAGVGLSSDDVPVAGEVFEVVFVGLFEVEPVDQAVPAERAGL